MTRGALRSRPTWIPLYAPEYPPVSRRRGYGDAAGLFGVAFGGQVVHAIAEGAHLFGAPVAGLRDWNLNAISVAGAALWGLVVLCKERDWVGRIGAVSMLGILVVAAAQVRSTASPEVWGIAQTLMSGGLCLELARGRGLTLPAFGIKPAGAATPQGRREAVGVAVTSFAGHCFTAPAGLFITLFTSGIPEPPAAAYHGIEAVAHMTLFSVVEEMVLVAGVVAPLAACRRPAWQTYAAGLAMRLSIHLHSGLSALTVLASATVDLWLYRHTRRLTPLICAAILYDAAAAFGGRPAATVFVAVGAFTSLHLVSMIRPGGETLQAQVAVRGTGLRFLTTFATKRRGPSPDEVPSGRARHDAVPATPDAKERRSC